MKRLSLTKTLNSTHALLYVLTALFMIAPSLASFNQIDFYAVLGVSRTATSAEIRKAHRKLVIKYHPDRSNEADKAENERLFRQVQLAYEVLIDDEKRRRYDFSYSNPSENRQSHSHRKTAASPLRHEVLFGLEGSYSKDYIDRFMEQALSERLDFYHRIRDARKEEAILPTQVEKWITAILQNSPERGEESRRYFELIDEALLFCVKSRNPLKPFYRIIKNQIFVQQNLHPSSPSLFHILNQLIVYLEYRSGFKQMLLSNGEDTKAIQNSQIGSRERSLLLRIRSRSFAMQFGNGRYNEFVSRVDQAMTRLSEMGIKPHNRLRRATSACAWSFYRFAYEPIRDYVTLRSSI